jgi:hypothetical protein
VIRQDVRISRAQLEDAELRQIFALIGAGQPRAGSAALFVCSIANLRSMAVLYGRARRSTARFPARADEDGSDTVDAEELTSFIRGDFKRREAPPPETIEEESDGPAPRRDRSVLAAISIAGLLAMAAAQGALRPAPAVFGPGRGGVRPGDRVPAAAVGPSSGGGTGYRDGPSRGVDPCRS